MPTPDLGALIGALFTGGGGNSDFSDTLMAFLPQMMGISGEVELPGFLQMMLGMLDAQFSNAPPEYVVMVLVKSREIIDALITKYAPGVEVKREAGAVISEDQGY